MVHSQIFTALTSLGKIWLNHLREHKFKSSFQDTLNLFSLYGLMSNQTCVFLLTLV